MAQVNSRTAHGRVTGWTGQVRRALLAGVGVAFLAKDEVQDLVNKLVEKGETAERDGRKLVSGLLSQPARGLTDGGKRVIDLLGKGSQRWQKNVRNGLDTARGVTAGLAGTLQKRWHNRIERVLHRMNLVSRDDVEDLNHKIDQLSRKLDRLGKK